MVPYHSFVFNAIGDAELCSESLEAAALLLERTNAPVINHPDAVRATGRADNARRLGMLPGVRAPLTVYVSRDDLLAAGAPGLLQRMGLTFPLLLRTPGFHTGLHFAKIDDAAALPAGVAELPGDRLTAIEYLDARAGDGLNRKYRAIAVDGTLHPLHLAIASDWKVHYFTAEMADYPERRAEEAAFLNDMPAVIGAKAMAALSAIVETLQLDYAGIDFGLSADGSVLLYEANATMMVPPHETDTRFAYRAAAAERVFHAVRAMLIDRAGRRTPSRA
jgi:hypothetical protein